MRITTLLALLVFSISALANDVKFGITPPIKENAKLTKLQQEIYYDIRAGREISREKILEARIEKHGANYNRKYNTNHSTEWFKKVLENSLPGEAASDSHDLKVKLEDSMKKNFAKKELYYNQAYVNPFDQMLSGRSQCFAGTICYDLQKSAIQKEEYKDENSVIVFTEGHVLPGVMTKKENGFWELNGIETTVSGQGKVEFGSVKSYTTPLVGLFKKLKPLRIVDGDLYALYDIFEDQLDANKKGEFISKILKATAEKYNLDLKKLERRLTKNFRNSSDSSFAFGDYNKTEGDLNKALIESIDPTKMQISINEYIEASNQNCTYERKEIEKLEKSESTSNNVFRNLQNGHEAEKNWRALKRQKHCYAGGPRTIDLNFTLQSIGAGDLTPGMQKGIVTQEFVGINYGTNDLLYIQKLSNGSYNVTVSLCTYKNSYGGWYIDPMGSNLMNFYVPKPIITKSINGEFGLVLDAWIVFMSDTYGSSIPTRFASGSYFPEEFYHWLR